MEKNIKDYLHLYLGCEVVYPSLNGDLKGIITHKLLSDIIVPHGLLKPLLRPLADMSGEEIKEYEAMVEVAKDYGGLKVNTWSESFVCELAEQTRWLLSKHFDLFSLIPSGLALEKQNSKILNYGK